MSKISFITWVNDPVTYERFKKSVSGFQCEFIAVGQEYRSMASAYNAGTDSATGDILVYVHQDVEILDPDFCSKLDKTLSDESIGFVGAIGSVAGDDRGLWFEMPLNVRRGHVVEADRVVSCGVYNGEARLLDGFFMATKKKFNFPEALPHIHFLDAWMCKEAMHQGYRNWIADIELKHWSSGNIGDIYYRYNKQLYLDKWFETDPELSASVKRALNRIQLRQFTEADYGKLSVVIAVLNECAHTERCLKTLLDDVPNAEVIVVNNGSTDNTLKVLKRFSSVKVINLPTNIGVPAAWNLGLSAAKGDILCVLNNDTTIHRYGMQTLAHAAFENGISSAKGGMLRPDLQFYKHTDNELESDYAEGSCLLFRRDVWKDVGKFDEIYSPAYFEDSDWCIRARLKGYSWKIVPGAIEHSVAVTSRHVELNLARNYEIFKQKYTGLGIGVRALIKREDAIGDILMATPAIQAFRMTNPLAKIHLLTKDKNVVFCKALPIIDHVSSIPEWIYTHVFDLNNAYESEKELGQFSSAVMSFAKRMDVAVKAQRYTAPVIPQDVLEWAVSLKLPRKAIAVGLRSQGRHYANWGASKWLQLFKMMPDWVFVLLDAQKNPHVNVDTDKHSSAIFELPNVINLTGKTPSLLHATAVVKQCVSCVTVDTGILHICNAVDVPVVGLFGGVPQSARAPLVGKYWFIQGDAPCFPCNSFTTCTRGNHPHCLSHIEPESVKRHLLRLIGGRTGNITG